VEPGERDRRVGTEVQGVPRVVPQTAPHDHHGADDDGDEEAGADRRGDHPRVARQQPRHLVRDRDPIERRIAQGDEDDVRQHKQQSGAAVSPVPDRQAIEPHEALEPGDSRQEQDLDQSKIRTEEPRDPADAREEVACGLGREAAAGDPEAGDDAGVRQDDAPYAAADQGPPRARPA
jgi:hypothetical protein